MKPKAGSTNNKIHTTTPSDAWFVAQVLPTLERVRSGNEAFVEHDDLFDALEAEVIDSGKASPRQPHG